jgi:hypothetical protein
MNITIDIREVNEICRQALLDHAVTLGLKDASIEGCIERLIRKNTFINCKRRGVVITGLSQVTVDPPVALEDLPYKELQSHAKSIGLKADGTKEVILERIGKRDADIKAGKGSEAEETSETEGSGSESTDVDVSSDIRDSERTDSPEGDEKTGGVQ